jgi:hypothetical protein
MRSLNTFYLILFTLTLAFSGCDEEEIGSEETGEINIEFDNHVGDDDLQLNTDYTNASGESFRITKLNYYISNISLKTKGGFEYVVPQDSSYFLVSEDHEDSQKINIKNIPAGDYNEITFIIGVDSLRSTMDLSKRTGVLDPAQGHDGMYWVWNSGYIFFKMEGTSPAAPTEQENKFYYHIGGFGGFDSPTINNIKEKTISMGSAHAEIRSGKSPQVHLHADVQEIFKSMKIVDHPLVMHGEYASTFAGNYVNMFKYDHVHN